MKNEARPKDKYLLRREEANALLHPAGAEVVDLDDLDESDDSLTV